uniref:Uncharacterized protein n=1 Tax=Magallana gigas TaxID=29159 RepID=K1RD91_MAGGI
MSNEMEYFAEAVSSFFNVERLQSAAGGMNTSPIFTVTCAQTADLQPTLDLCDFRTQGSYDQGLTTPHTSAYESKKNNDKGSPQEL